MKPGERLLVCGASARAAAMSAAAAGITPFAIDLFNDADLLSTCDAVRIPVEDYPRKLAEYAARGAPPGPWMYTGGLENHPGVVDAISRVRPLWGSTGDVLRHIRDPFALAELLQACDIPVPECRPFYQGAPTDGSWLAKPLAGAGGAGIQVWRGPPLPRRCGRGAYFQQLLAGQSHSAVYFADGNDALLLGITEQLVGEAALHAGPFAYCGSLGPVDLGLDVERLLGDAGALLANCTGLRGLFGLDFVLQNELPWVVEINPRYTASVEVLEAALDVQFLGMVASHFEEGLQCGEAAPLALSATGPLSPPSRRVAAKAIWFAPRDLVFRPEPLRGMESSLRDVPVPGAAIDKGQPVITVCALADSVEQARALLWERVRDLDRRLIGS